MAVEQLGGYVQGVRKPKRRQIEQELRQVRRRWQVVARKTVDMGAAGHVGGPRVEGFFGQIL